MRSAKRTSCSCTCDGRDAWARALIERACRLTGKPESHIEEVQVARYTTGQECQCAHRVFTPRTVAPPHAFLTYVLPRIARRAVADQAHDDCGSVRGLEYMVRGGQRVATALIYLNDVARGGATAFPKLGVEVRPRRGRCLLFFPAFTDGRRDEQTVHAALPAVDEKWVCQMWVRQHVNPLSVLRPPRWPRGVHDFAGLVKLVLGLG